MCHPVHRESVRSCNNMSQSFIVMHYDSLCPSKAVYSRLISATTCNVGPPTSTAASQQSVFRELSGYRSSTMTATYTEYMYYRPSVLAAFGRWYYCGWVGIVVMTRQSAEEWSPSCPGAPPGNRRQVGRRRHKNGNEIGFRQRSMFGQLRSGRAVTVTSWRIQVGPKETTRLPYRLTKNSY